jgi:uncharacterized protein YjbJ (UPF0337 family)
MRIEVCFSVERGDSEVELLVRADYTVPVKARTYGPPELCSPAEGGDVEIVEIVLDAKGNAKWDGELTESEREDAEEKLAEQANEELQSRYEDAADAAADAAEAREDYFDC